MRNAAHDAQAAVAAACLLAASAAFAAHPAEFAVHWNPADGGPQTAEDVTSALQLDGGKLKAYEVRYFAVRQPLGDTGRQDAIAIVRQRKSSHESESMYKLRSTQAFGPGDPLAGWRCPLASSANARSKSTVDIGWLAEGQARRTYSLSCEAHGAVDAILPAKMQARPLDCSSRVRRVEVKDIKIEQWRMPDAETILDVSWNGEDTAADLEKFAARIVRPLVARGIRPHEQSKTELGSGC
jgi:hypothetical protein